MTRRPLVHGPIFETIPPPPPFRVGDQRLYAIFGPAQAQLNVRQQRLYMITDESSVTDFRYWRLLVASTQNVVKWEFATLEFRATVGGADATGAGTALNYGEGLSAANAFDGDPNTDATSAISPEPSAWGYDFGAGNEIAIAEVSLTASLTSIYTAPYTFEIQASNDNVRWQSKKVVLFTTLFTAGETRNYAL